MKLALLLAAALTAGVAAWRWLPHHHHPQQPAGPHLHDVSHRWRADDQDYPQYR